VLEANTDYWDTHRFPRLKRIVFDNTLDQKEAVELVKTSEGRVDLVTELSPLETLRVAQSPFAQVVKARGSFTTVSGQFNLRKAGSPWSDVRLRQAVNLAINRVDPALAPYPFDPGKARRLLREAGYPNGLAMTLIAPNELEVQATVVSKMLEGVGLTVDRQILDPPAYNRQTLLTALDHPPEQHTWDIALMTFNSWANIPALQLYRYYFLGGPYDWGVEKPELQRLYEEFLRTVDPERQQALIRQMERHTRDHAYALFLYNPIQLYAVNQAVEFVPSRGGNLTLPETSVTEQHWSVRQTTTKKE
jgi:peptide/nickel transport system substrate-binding protein